MSVPVPLDRDRDRGTDLATRIQSGAPDATITSHEQGMSPSGSSMDELDTICETEIDGSDLEWTLLPDSRYARQTKRRGGGSTPEIGDAIRVNGDGV